LYGPACLVTTAGTSLAVEVRALGEARFRITAPDDEFEGSPVELWALGEDRFAVRAPGHQQIVTGFEGRDLASRSRSRSASHVLEVLLFDALPRAIHAAQ
jgi:hypothetical protein